MLTYDADVWAAAGGDPRKLALLRTVGEIAPFVTEGGRCLAGIHPALPGVGAVGDWEGEDAPRLEAEAWLRGRGVTVLRAPMELCTWFGYRVSLGPHEEPPFLMEPTERPERWLAAGYAPAAHYASVLMPHDEMIEVARDAAMRLSTAGWTVSSLPVGPDGKVPADAFAAGVEHVHAVAHEAFADAYGFAPLPLAALQASYAPYREAVAPQLVQFAHAPGGEVAAFAFGIPDLAAPGRPWFIMKTVATRPAFHGSGAGTWLCARVHQEARRLGFTHAVYALMWEQAPSNRWSRHGGRLLRRYALLEKPG